MVSIAWRTGVNMREFAYFGTDVIDPGDPANTPALQDTQLTALRDLNVKLVRFYASHNRFTTAQSIDRIRTALKKIGAAGMQAIVCLDDSVRDSGCFVPGNDPIFCPAGPVGHYLKQYYGSQLYNSHYMGHLEAIVTAFRSDPAVAMWELSNEAALHPQQPTPPVRADFDAYFNFVQAASQKIKSIAPNHLVSTGLACVRHVVAFGQGDAQAHAQAKQLYNLPTVDVISFHLYEEDGLQEAQWREIWDVATAKEVNKPFYVGEIGANNHQIDRVAYHRDQIQHWRDLGAFSVMPWQFNELRNDLRISDGFARMFPDFDALKTVVKSFGAEVAAIRLGNMDINPFAKTGAQDAALFGQDTESREYRVNQAGQAIFAGPDAKGDKIAEGLVVDAHIHVNPNSRIEKDGFVLWQVSGWVVERPLTVEENAPEALLHFIKPPRRKLKFKVIFKGDIFLRSDPSRNPAKPKANVIGEVKTDAIIEVYEDTRTVTNDGYVWWQHDDGHVEDKPDEKIVGGWSAETGDGKIFLEAVIEIPPVVINNTDGGNSDTHLPLTVEPFYQNPDETEIDVNQLPLRDALFLQVPVSFEEGWILQPYGNTKFAFDSCPYAKFFQGLHSGIDFGIKNANRKAGIVEVRALVHGKVEEIITTSYQPYGVRVRVGDYSVIFGHMDFNDQRVKKNDLVTPDTILGHIANDDELKAYSALPGHALINFWPHLHFEIRYLPATPDRILNPLMFFSPSMRQQIIKGINMKHFFSDTSIFGEWLTPLRQPVIKFGGPKIGPLSVTQGGCK